MIARTMSYLPSVVRSRARARTLTSCSVVASLALAACGGGSATTAGDGTTAAGASRAASIRFHVTPTPERPAQVSVTACYTGVTLSPTPPLAHVTEVTREGGGEPLLVSDGSVDLRPLASGDCIAYDADLPVDQQTSFGGGDAGFWAGPLHQVLVLPHTASRSTPVTVELALPSDASYVVSLPSEAGVVRTDVAAIRGSTLAAWGSGIAQGEATEGGAALRYTVLPGAEWPVQTVSSWLLEAVRGASSALGRFPYRSLSLVAVPVDDEASPVVFDHLVPGDGGLLVVRVHRGLASAALREHPSAMLEMLRLGVPTLAEDEWLIDGLLGYYREVLSARLGYQPANDTFRHIHTLLARFQARRDRPDSLDPGELALASEDAPKGLALALAADAALRAADGSLDARMAAAFGDEARRNAMRSADDVIAALDAGLPEPLFAPLARRIGRGGADGVVSEAYGRLGMSPARRGRLELRSAGGAGARRAAITAPIGSGATGGASDAD